MNLKPQDGITIKGEGRDMKKMLKAQSRLLLLLVLAVFSLFLLGAVKMDSSMKSNSVDKNEAIINNLLECNKQLDASWQQIVRKNPMLILRIEASK
jgi:hypothetical protein